MKRILTAACFSCGFLWGVWTGNGRNAKSVIVHRASNNTAVVLDQVHSILLFVRSCILEENCVL